MKSINIPNFPSLPFPSQEGIHTSQKADIVKHLLPEMAHKKHRHFLYEQKNLAVHLFLDEFPSDTNTFFESSEANSDSEIDSLDKNANYHTQKRSSEPKIKDPSTKKDLAEKDATVTAPSTTSEAITVPTEEMSITNSEYNPQAP